MLNLNKKFELEEKEDITDVFDRVQNDEEVLNKLEELISETPKYQVKHEEIKEERISVYEIEDDKIGLERARFNIPNKYRISNKMGILYNYVKNGKEYEKNIFPIPVFISKILKNIDSGNEKVEISFLYQRKEWRTILVDKNTLVNKNIIVNLANRGVPVTSSNANDLIEWLSAFEVENYGNLKIEKTISKTGWIDNKTFVPFRSEEVCLDLEEGIRGWVENIRKRKRDFRRMARKYKRIFI